MSEWGTLMAETLRILVKRLADMPTIENRDAFYRALLVSEVSSPLTNLPTDFRPGKTVADGQISVQNTRAPDGSTMLLVYTDDQAALQVPLAKAGFRLAGRVVLEMALTNKYGVIVASGHGASTSWAGIPRDHVAKLLARTEKSS